MTEPKLCPTTLRWAAQHILNLRTPQSEWAHQWALAYEADAHTRAAQSLDTLATEAELAEAKRKATALVLEPALTVGAMTPKEVEQLANLAYITWVGAGRFGQPQWDQLSDLAREQWREVARFAYEWLVRGDEA